VAKFQGDRSRELGERVAKKRRKRKHQEHFISPPVTTVHGRPNNSDKACWRTRLEWTHGPGAYKLGLVMGQHVDVIAIYSDTDIIARFRVRQLRVVVLVDSRV